MKVVDHRSIRADATVSRKHIVDPRRFELLHHEAGLVGALLLAGIVIGNWCGSDRRNANE
jgi:hypothetical protein